MADLKKPRNFPTIIDEYFEVLQRNEGRKNRLNTSGGIISNEIVVLQTG